ncbi:hypothetical protein CUJ84_pRLN3000231 (plasmid) [Rhizobium leguminosarum]|uniref:Uncharacterized protein n=1 Tax=Rhizobium leguminosarum TaxID=384 RepID=A0A2K9ZGL3_RHILE|nr:hypothetical protein CUJ84_pRLN3000231 [Rhizobium leguminosarum]
MRLFPTPNVSVAVPIKDNGDSVVARGRSSKGLGQGGARDLRLTDLLLMHPPNNATFVHTQLHNRAGLSILLKSWPILSKLHLKKGICRHITVARASGQRRGIPPWLTPCLAKSPGFTRNKVEPVRW